MIGGRVDGVQLVVGFLWCCALLRTTVGDSDQQEFRVYWNIPTFQCKPFNLATLDNVTADFGIVQNDGDDFRGQHISILYDPGQFPALFDNATTAPRVRRNGGVPQAGNLAEHLRHFERDVNTLIPDPNNSGLAVIDFEAWRPIYRQNFGALEPYQRLSMELVQQNVADDDIHSPASNTTSKYVRTEAKRQFETAAREFMLATLRVARQLRPLAQWGYYGLPLCFNKVKESCAVNIQDENDGIDWLLEAQQVVLPSVYWTERFEAANRVGMVRGRVAEAMRMARWGQPVLVYYRFVFADTHRYLSMIETQAIFRAIRDSGADGIVLWGASVDLNGRRKCAEFGEYLRTVLGPAAAEFSSAANAGSATTTGGGRNGFFVVLLLPAAIVIVVRNRLWP